MENFIRHLEIDNFKSIRHCSIEEFHRINLFIGRPNVGKSNIIEALSIYSLPYLHENSSKKLTNLIRLENEPELFYNGSIIKDARINSNIGNCRLEYNAKNGLRVLIDFFDFSYNISVDDKLVVKETRKTKSFDPPVKRYNYKSDVAYRRSHARYLIPSFGFNMLAIIEEYPSLKEQVTALFKEYGLEIAFDKSSQTIKVIQSWDSKSIFLIPYNSIADTLQRIIFYMAAIASNNNSILLFDGPEAHSFPPYMSHITQEMIYKPDNQYFVATHSSFILNDLFENGMNELAVFMVYYEDFETKIRKLTDEELHGVFQNGVDLFTNSESFV